ncbi:MAG: amylo-alpha-1,6-glucosidase [bacterium]
MTFHFSRNHCLNLEDSLRCEWLETNSLGGYASSTILGCHTRKYHGLLIAPLKDFNAKFNLLSNIGLAIHVAGKVFHLSTNKFPEVFDPTGHKYIDSFDCDTHPITTYKIGDITFIKELIMPQHENTVILKYKLQTSSVPIKIHLHPRLTYRQIHELTHDNIYMRVKTYTMQANTYKIQPYDSMPPLYFDTSHDVFFHPGPYWIHNFEYLKERSRGFDYHEDMFTPGVFEYEMKAGDVLYFRASLDQPTSSGKSLFDEEHKRRLKEIKKYAKDSIPLRTLKKRAGQFIINNVRGETSIVAGYHWFDEWGRDAMIALPGLTLYCGKDDEALAVLKTYAKHEKNGLIPNYLATSGNEHAYNSIDASLWFFWAIQQYCAKTKKTNLVKKDLFPAMENIITAFYHNTVRHVHLNDQGLLWVGNEHTQLTWMDAQVFGQPVTPRNGYAVELNALWYNALSFYCDFCDQNKIKYDSHLREILIRLRESFISTFWREDLGYLVDVVNDNGQDQSIRPNQIMAVSLPYSMLNREQQEKVASCVETHLLTPYGLRTLSPQNLRYQPEYSGAPAKRDAAYHQGTVWPWLLGHFTEATLKCADNPKEKAGKMQKKLSPLWHSHLRIGCLGGISEIFNADPPHTYKGAIQQAWSVAEVIRALTLLEKV